MVQGFVVLEFQDYGYLVWMTRRFRADQKPEEMTVGLGQPAVTVFFGLGCVGYGAQQFRGLSTALSNQA